MQRTCARVVIILVIVLSVGSYIFAPIWFTANLFVHWQWQYTLVLAVFAGYALDLKMPRLALVAVIYAGVLAVSFPAMSLRADVPSGTPDIGFMNVQYSNEEWSDIVKAFAILRPETIALVEARADVIRGLAPWYGKPVVYHDQAGLSCAIFSERMPQEVRIDTDTAYPICTAIFDNYTVIAVHPLPPFSQGRLSRQVVNFGEIRALYDFYRKDGKPVVIVGDFNTTVYDRSFSGVFSGLIQGNYASWSTPMPWMLPIDHALSEVPLEVSRMPRLSSDHAGLLVTLP